MNILDRVPFKLTMYFCKSCNKFHRWPSKNFFAHAEANKLPYPIQEKPCLTSKSV